MNDFRRRGNDLLVSVNDLLPSVNDLLVQVNHLLVSINDLLGSMNHLLTPVNHLLKSLSSSRIFVNDLFALRSDLTKTPFLFVDNDYARQAARMHISYLFICF